MRLNRVLLAAALIAGIGTAAYAELQNVTIGGSIRIRGSWYHGYDNGPFLGINAGPGARELSLIEQRTRLSATADFTEDVTAFIEIDSYDVWGEDFRSNPVTGLDGRAASIDDVEIYQGYIEARNMWGTDLSMRVGRQELVFGNEWLLGNNDTAAFFGGLSYDALRLTYGNEDYQVDAFAAKLAESGSDVGEKDTNLYGVYATVNGGLITDRLEDVDFDAYYLWFNDDGPAAGNFAGGRLMDIHTTGLRIAGTIDAFDFNAEGAFQFGYVGRQGLSDVDYANWAVNTEAGYTFDVTTTPRIYGGFAMFTGEDSDDTGTVEVGFNRLFSDWEYTEFFENTEMSNAMIARLGGSLNPTEDLNLLLASSYFFSHIEDDSFGDDANRFNGIELGLYATYNYSDDLVFRAGYAHLFTMDGFEEGDGWLGALNGLAKISNNNPDDADYWFLEAELSF